MLKRSIAAIALIAYYAMLIKVMVLKELPTIHIGQLIFNLGGTNGGQPPNFIPFTTIVPYLFGEQGLVIAGVNLLGNVALLVPIGLLIPFILKDITWKKSLAVAVAAGLFIEVLQAILNVGIFDVDDVILNALGVFTGYWTFKVFAKWIGAKKYKNIVFTLVAIIAVCVGSLYALYPKNQPVVNPANRLASEGSNPCGRTQGTGQITDISTSTITIRRNDGSFQKIDLTSKTTFRTSAGEASKAVLQPGDRVTVVVDDSETASTVLVCGVR
jgi:glycopeptide antibiotics resistance protein